MKTYKFIPIVILTLFFLIGCNTKRNTGRQPDVVVTNSYIAACVEDILPDLDVVCLTPPGMCPGHFDISPAQVQELVAAKVLLCFDFQSGMVNQMKRLQECGLKITPVISAKGLCKAESYLQICSDVADKLINCYPEKSQQIKTNLEQVKIRIAQLDTEIKIKIKDVGLSNAAVISSTHQSKFASYLGFNVVSTFLGRDMATPSNLGQCLESADGMDIKFIIANKQEGTELAAQLAKRLNSKIVVFSNFPDTTFDDMIKSNIGLMILGGEK